MAAAIFDYKPIADLELVRRGYAAVFISMEDLYGSPKAMDVMDQFYRYLVGERGFSRKNGVVWTEPWRPLCA